MVFKNPHLWADLYKRELKNIFKSPCDYCYGYDYEMNKCKYFVCDTISRIEAEKRMKKND